MKRTPPAKPGKLEKLIREIALNLPETHEDHPWGESALKVKNKAFVFMGAGKDELSFSVKLPKSRDFALTFPFAEPTHYGLGKHGWVSFTISSHGELPADLVRTFILESYRSVAPKKLAAQV